MHERAPGMHVEPVDREFEAASEYLVGKRRRGESAVDVMRRVVRVRELLRAEKTLRRVRELAPSVVEAAERDGGWVS